MPSVFISYSHEPQDPSHGEKVAGLAASLLAGGLKVYSDQNRGGDEEGVPWPIWMESKIDIADFVLLVCTKLYLAKVQQRVAPNEGFGVCWEANLIYNALYQAKLNTTKFLPVLFGPADRQFIPGPLAGANHFILDSDQSFTQLYAFLTGQHRAHFPAQGSSTAVIPQKTVQPLFSLVKSGQPPLKPQPSRAAVAKRLPPAIQPLTLKADIPPKPRQDIRGLDWYEECDAQHFLGREEDSSRLLSMLLDHPVIRLVGPSGVGKSSLIRAGLLPKIRAFGWRACVLRPFEDPAHRIPEQLSESLLISGRFFSAPLNATSLRAELTGALAAAGTKRLVLLLDQFEDIVSPSAGLDAVDSMRLWLRELWEKAQTSPSLRVIVVYRTDAEARLGRLWQEITGRSEGLPYLPVEGLSQEVAEKIIRQAAQERGWQIEASLPDLTRQLALESQKLGCSGDVFPVYLQILLRQVADASSGRLTPELMESLGGVSALIGRFLEQSLARLKARGGDWQHCGRVLEALSRSSGTKSALRLEDMVRECGLSHLILTEMLTVLIHERLVRPIGHETYEIQHDRLASAIIDSMKAGDREAKQAREFLAAKIPLFERTRTPLSGAELVTLYRHRRLINPSPRELPIILASALNAIMQDNKGWHVSTSRTPIPFVFWFSKLEQRDWWRIILHLEQWRVDHGTMIDFSGKWADQFPIHSLEEEVVGLARHHASNVRRLCAVWLRTLANNKYAPVLRTLVKDIEEHVRIEALKTLTKLSQKEDFPLMRELVKDYDDSIRAEAVKAISKSPQEEDLPLLRKAASRESIANHWHFHMRDGDFDTCISAIIALADLQQEEAFNALRIIAKRTHRQGRHFGSSGKLVRWSGASEYVF